jgi:hypothetical protein
MEEDLFNTPELLPQEVRDIIEKYEEMDTCYEMCQNLIEELEPHGYTCGYGLDAIPYELTKIKTNKTMKNTILKIVKQNEYDRYVFINYSNDEIVGLNFWQGLYKESYECAMNDKMYEPCIHLTDIYNRLKIIYEEISNEERINKAIDLYTDAFVIQGRGQKENTLLPKEQTEIIKEALSYYLEQFKKFNELPTESEEYKIYDLTQLQALMNYDVKIELTSKEKENFTFKNGIDFPLYN